MDTNVWVRGLGLTAFLLAGCASDIQPPAAGPGSNPGGNPPGSSAPDGGSAAAGTLPCDVERVLQQRCQSCHRKPPLFGAPMPLLSWSDTQAPALSGQGAVRQMMKSKLENGLMPPPSTPSGPLSAAE